MQVGPWVLFGFLAPTELLCCSLDLYKYLTFALFLNVPLKILKGFRETYCLGNFNPFHGGNGAAPSAPSTGALNTLCAWKYDLDDGF